jgi:hypothetical protein
MIECNPRLASTPIASADKDMFIASLRFPIWPYDCNILMDNKLKTRTTFVLNKPQLVVRILGEFLLSGLVVKASLILKSRLIVVVSYNCVDIPLLSFGSEMFLAVE